MRVPVVGARLPEEGASGDFLFHRREDHFHQGLDIGAFHDPETSRFTEREHRDKRLRGELPILSVLGGTVVHAQKNDVGTYGRTIVVRSETSVRGTDETLWLLYSHCSTVFHEVGDTVLAGQLVALVGWSGNARRSNPHLHFEIATAKLPTTGGPKHETTPSIARIRIDPRTVLRALPPFGKQVFLPLAESPREATAKRAEFLHDTVETAAHGGYFPLGANNTWHGGVHLPFQPSEHLFCPLEGQIVAARLDPDPATSMRQHGDTNFILVRHEISLRLYHQIRGTTPSLSPSARGPSGGKPTKKHGVGGKHDNDPDLVERVRDALVEKGHYSADAEVPELEPGTIEPALTAAIEAFQSTLDAPASFKPWPDGSIRFEGFTWDALFADLPEDGPSHPDDDTDPDPPDEPAHEDTSTPPRPLAPKDAERVVYSLFMHLAAETFTDALAARFPWLKKAHLYEPSVSPPTGIAEQLERARKHREDVDEANSHRIRKKMGRGEENADDVAWVRKRLIRFEYLPEDSEGETLDEALHEAIVRFQRELVFPKRLSSANGVIRRGRRTDVFLRKSRRALGLDPPGPPLDIDPLVRTLLSERGVDGMTRVVSNLSVPISAGEPLWTPGHAGGFADDGHTDVDRRVHWAMFSEHEMFVDDHDGWASVIDANEDLTADAPREVMELVADWPLGTPLDDLPPDGIIDPAELSAFYADPASNFLRRRQCHFRTEWGLDLDATVARLQDQGWAGADGLRASLLPYQWWFDAADVLPATTHVWHYNPIEFLEACRAGLQALAPPEPKSREEYGSVRIRVTNKKGGPGVDVRVLLVDAESTSHEGITNAPARNGTGGGTVGFQDVKKGPCTILLSLDGEVHPLVHEQVSPGWDANTFLVNTEFEGPEPTRGSIHATVRKFGGIFKPLVVVQLVDHAGTVVRTETSKNAKLRFDEVPLGEYVLRSVDGESAPETVNLDRRRTVRAVVRRKPDPVELMVTVLHDGSPAANVTVQITDAKSKSQVIGGLGQTDADGRCFFELRRGKHHVRVGKKKKHINLVSTHPNEALLDVSGDVFPSDPFGVLQVKISSPLQDARLPVTIFSTDDPATPLHELYPDADDTVTVRVPSGAYRVLYDDREAAGSVHGGTLATVEL